MLESEFIEIPITLNFRHDIPPVGLVKILKSALPENPDWVLSLGYIVTEQSKTTKYSIVELGLIRNTCVRK